jgi:hypothetical protein
VRCKTRLEFASACRFEAIVEGAGELGYGERKKGQASLAGAFG